MKKELILAAAVILFGFSMGYAVQFNNQRTPAHRTALSITDVDLTQFTYDFGSNSFTVLYRYKDASGNVEWLGPTTLTYEGAEVGQLATRLGITGLKAALKAEVKTREGM